MKLLSRFNVNGEYVESVMIEDDEQIPADCTEIELPQPNWKPVFQNGGWVETITQDELNAIKNTPPALSEIEQMQKDQADLTFQLMVKGVI